MLLAETPETTPAHFWLCIVLTKLVFGLQAWVFKYCGGRGGVLECNNMEGNKGGILENLYISFWSGNCSGSEQQYGAWLLVTGNWLYIAYRSTVRSYTFCPHSVFMCFVWIWEQTAIISLYVTICTASLTFNNSTFCPHSVFMCFVWISEQTAIISLYSNNWLVFITEI